MELGTAEKRDNKREQRKSETVWVRNKQSCTLPVFLQERFEGEKDTILTHCCLGLHNQPFFSSARRHSDLLVHLQTKDEKIPSAWAAHAMNAFTKSQFVNNNSMPTWLPAGSVHKIKIYVSKRKTCKVLNGNYISRVILTLIYIYKIFKNTPLFKLPSCEHLRYLVNRT